MHRRDLPVHVEMDGARLVRLRYGRSIHEVERLVEAWVVEGRWWGEAERREYVRVLTDRATLELYRTGGAWRLSRVID